MLFQLRPTTPPFFGKFGRAISSSLISFFLILLYSIAFSVVVHAQGFGFSKKEVTLQRKLPAVVQLPSRALDIRSSAQNPSGASLDQTFSDLLILELQKNDKRVRLEKNSPDAVITFSITEFQIPPPTLFVVNNTVLQKGHLVQQPKAFKRVTGDLTVAYRAQDSHGAILDADTIGAHYAHNFDATTNQAADVSVADNFKHMFGQKTDVAFEPPTPEQLKQQLLADAVSQLAARLVTTNETLKVPLARGKLDSAIELALKGQWQRYQETLETMTPFSDPADDAYRLYNIGVSYEALAYQSEDPKATEKFLEQAAINYGKAIDSKPGEKYFIDPQNRIQTAAAHFKKLQAGATTTTNVAGTTAPPAPGSGAPAPPPTPGSRSVALKTGGSASSLLDNTEVIKMKKAGVEDDDIIDAIHDAPTVQFDLSPNGLIDLANNGVKGSIVSAMRERSRPVSKRSAPRKPTTPP